MLATHLHSAPSLRMNGAIPPLILYALMTWTGISWHFFTLQDLLLAKEETMLQSIDRVNGIRIRYRMKMNVEEN